MFPSASLNQRTSDASSHQRASASNDLPDAGPKTAPRNGLTHRHGIVAVAVGEIGLERRLAVYRTGATNCPFHVRAQF